MNVYLMARKVMQGTILIILIAIIIYVVYRLMPGNPADLFLLSLKGKATPQAKEALLQSLGLAGGKWSFSGFLIYMKDMFTGNFGFDYYSQATVWEVISSGMPYSILLIGTATVLGWVIGIPLGITTTRLRNRKSESAILTSGLILSSIPYFILAIVLYLYLVAFGGFFPIASNFTWNESIITILYRISLPLISLTIVGAAGHLITMRATMVSILGEDFIHTARAKGVPEKNILRRHAARNAMIPISTRMALEFAIVASGALIVDIIFSYPGLGLTLYNATLQEDYPLAEAAAFMLSAITLVCYLIIDYIHAWLDPRIKV